MGQNTAPGRLCSSTLLLCCLLFATFATNATAQHSAQPVVVLDERNFTNVIPGPKMVLVKFYAPWCGHCRRLHPVMNELADMIYHDVELRANVLLAKVDCEAEKQAADQSKLLCPKYGVGSFPTLMLFPKLGAGERPTLYNGDRSKQMMFKYLKSVVKPPKAIRIYGFDLLAREFYKADPEARVEVLERAKRSAESFSKGASNEAVQNYVKLMEKAMSKGNPENFFEDELSRLGRLIASDLTPEKMTKMMERKAIAEGFVSDPLAPGVHSTGRDTHKAGMDEYDPGWPKTHDDDDDDAEDGGEEEANA